MSAPYWLRLLFLSLASFFVLNALVGLAARLATRTAVRIGEKLPPRAAARLLLAMRFLGPALGLVFVLGLCVPSYLRFEPRAESERIGMLCIALGVCGAAGWFGSLSRAGSSLAASLRLTRLWKHKGQMSPLPGEEFSAVVLEKGSPLLALAGVFRPRLVVSRGLLGALSNEQLAVALQHENAHRTSRDNLKRLALLLAPEALPFVKNFALLEREWAKFSEWAADDDAVRGDSRRAVLLADALVRVARLGTDPLLSYLHTSLLGGHQDLSARVDRLLHLNMSPAVANAPKWSRALTSGLCLAVCAVAVGIGPVALSSVHRLLEIFLR
jgi:Zn-dependent protease with chaperone function